jgi:hypothetical protein
MRRSTIGVVALALLTAHQACDRDFPAQPTPFANSPVTTLSGSAYLGSVFVNNQTTPLNMTLIARALGQSAALRALTQAPNTVEVTGSFATGVGLNGTIQGRLLEGTLQDGEFEGELAAAAGPAGPACTRTYSGPVTDSGVVWVRPVTSDACPLPVQIEAARTNGPRCGYSITASQTDFGTGGGKAILTVSTSGECPWRAESSVTWIMLTDPTPRVGPGTTPFTVAQNPAPAVSRQGQIRVSDQRLTITQAQVP